MFFYNGVCFSLYLQDNMTTFSAGVDGNVRMWNASQPPTSAQIIGRHDQPVRCMKFLPESNMLVTAGWDKSVRLWDCRSPNAAAVMPVSERVYAMDAKGSAIVVGTADRQVHVFNVQNKVAEFKSPLNYQTRCISIFADNQGFAMGSIEGRIAIEYFSEMEMKMQQQQRPANAPKPTMRGFVFKFHRDANDIFAVNTIDFHKQNTFVTAGSDGVLATWDKDARHRLSIFEMHKRRCPVTCAKFSPMGDMMFYALSYDWSKGAEHNNATMGNNIVVHQVADSDVAPKNKSSSSLRR
jgi:mRNA export factor